MAFVVMRFADEKITIELFINAIENVVPRNVLSVIKKNYLSTRTKTI